MLEKAPPALGRILEGVRAGMDKLVWANEGVAAPETIKVVSEAFAESEPIPYLYTEDGEKISPPLSWSGTPAGAVSVILVVEDADSPTPSPIVHALVYDLPPGDCHLKAGALPSKGGPGEAAGYAMGRNSFRAAQYLAPDPPPAHGPHRYVFQVYALDRRPDLSEEPEKSDILTALLGHVIARGSLTGTYERGRG